MSNRYVLGIDGGGTKTEIVLADFAGNIMDRKIGAATAINSVKFEDSVDTISELISRALEFCSFIEELELIYVGISGYTRWMAAREKKILQDKIAKTANAKNIFFDDDGDLGVAVKSAELFSDENHYVSILSGTGVGCYGRNKEGTEIFHHGWGYLMGDEGSGYDIGRRAIIAVLQYLDKRGRKTSLREMLYNSELFKEIKNINNVTRIPQDQLKIANYYDYFGQFVDLIYKRGLKREEIASLAPFVFQEARRGDAIAKCILKGAGKELGKTINAVIKWLNLEREALTIYPIGGVFKAGELVLDFLEEEVKKLNRDVAISSPIFDPVIGSIVGAYHVLGIKLNSRLKTNLLANSHEIAPSEGSKSFQSLD